MNRNRQIFLLFLLISAALSPRHLAAQPTPVGPEVRVDTLAGDQYPNCPNIGVAPNRSFEIAWDYGGGAPQIKARHYNAAGMPTDPSEVLLASLAYYPVVLDVSPVSTGFRTLMEVIDDLGAPSKFYRKRIYPSGAPVGTPRPVGVTGTTDWVSSGPGDTVFAGTYDAALRRLSMQKVNSLGVPAGTMYILNTRPIDAQARPQIAVLTGGGWVAVFTGYSIASPGVPARQVIRARRFDAAGAPLGPDFDVNSILAGAPGLAPFLGFSEAVVAGGPGGGFAVSWHLIGGGDRLFLRFFKATGVPAAPETLVATSDLSTYPISAAFDGSGRLLLLWGTTLDTPTFPDTLRARLYKPSGIPAGPAFNPASAASGAFDEPFCGNLAWAGGSWLITWTAQRADSRSRAIFVRRFQ
jgi:hypothetical protein